MLIVKLRRLPGTVALTLLVTAAAVGMPRGAMANDKLKTLDQAADNVEASTLAMKQILSDPSTDLLTVLTTMNGKSAVSKNWYLSVAQAVADRDPEQSKAILEQFLTRLSEDGDARYWAFAYVTNGQPELRKELLGSMLADPCLELRYEAVELQREQLEASDAEKPQRVARYRELLAASRLPEQIQAIGEKLEELGEKTDLLELFGFLPAWQVVGPFDNVGLVGFAKDYPVEAAYAAGTVDLAAKFEGKAGSVAWAAVLTDSPDGSIDLKGQMENAKGAVAYALGEFKAGQETDCELRIGSPNAVKVWLNGDLVISREVYHSGNQIDQYTTPVKLKSGNNTILVKSCQNEQTEPWAQDWNFQLRFTDTSGLAIQPVQ